MVAQDLPLYSSYKFSTEFAQVFKEKILIFIQKLSNAGPSDDDTSFAIDAAKMQACYDRS